MDDYSQRKNTENWAEYRKQRMTQVEGMKKEINTHTHTHSKSMWEILKEQQMASIIIYPLKNVGAQAYQSSPNPPPTLLCISTKSPSHVILPATLEHSHLLFFWNIKGFSHETNMGIPILWKTVQETAQLLLLKSVFIYSARSCLESISSGKNMMEY